MASRGDPVALNQVPAACRLGGRTGGSSGPAREMRTHTYKESANRAELSRANPCARLSQPRDHRFQMNGPGLCRWVAEREGFEPSIQLETV